MNAREGRRQGYMHLLDNQQHVGNVSGRVEEESGGQIWRHGHDYSG
jgi:hypothetical protein